MRKLLLVAGCLALAACFTDPQDARRVLEDQGYTDVQITGYAFAACGEHDTYSTGFTATSPNGRRIGGTVCKGAFFKNQTVRFN
jgi:hypothetical protein